MSKQNSRGKQEVQDALRSRGFELLKKGKKAQEISAILGVGRLTVFNWKKILKNSNFKAPKTKKRGRSKGDSKRLLDDQEKKIIQWITDKDPEQLKFRFALWSREAIKSLIQQEFAINLPLRTITDYLKRWGFSAQSPKKKAYEQDDKRVKKFLEEEYPSIETLAKKEGAEIQWADETHLVSLPNYIRGFAPVGQTPTLKKPAKKFKINMISSISNRGTLRWMIYDDQKMDAKVFIKFLKRLIKSNKKKVFLIVDNLRVHHAKLVKNWVEENKENIRIFYLPPYSPELNPDEYLNCDLKANVNKYKIPHNQKELKSNTLSFMRKLQNQPNKVAKYFCHPAVKHAS